MNIFRSTLVVVRALSMTLWVGGMAGFAFIVAPVAFRIMGPTPAFAAMIATMLGDLTLLGAACAAVAIAATLLLGNHRSRYTVIFVAMVLAMSALSLYERTSVIPQMQHTSLQTPAYETLHRKSAAVYGAVLLIGVAAISLISARNAR